MNDDSSKRDDLSGAGPGEAPQAPAVAPDRREAIAVIGKFAAFVAPMTVVLLDANQAQAAHCSNHTNTGVGTGLCP